MNLALLRQDPSRAFMESVLACGFCRRFQQHSRKERGEQPFFLWHRRDGGCTQSAASGAGEPEDEVGEEEREKEWYGKVGVRAQLAN